MCLPEQVTCSSRRVYVRTLGSGGTVTGSVHVCLLFNKVPVYLRGRGTTVAMTTRSSLATFWTRHRQ